MKNIKILTEPMSLTELAVRASYQVVVMDENLSTATPESMGSGCILMYKERLFFLTVAHVTDFDNTIVLVETNKTSKEGNAETYCVGAMNYFKVGWITNEDKPTDPNDPEAALFETIDFAFAELKEPIEALQNEVDFQHHGKVHQSTKIIIPESQLDSQPSSDKLSLFFGTINPLSFDVYLERQPKLTVDCRFDGVKDNYYKFTLPRTVNNSAEFRGTSGSPIFDEDSNFLGLITFGYVGTDEIYIFPNTEIKRYLDYYMVDNPDALYIQE